MLQLAPVQYEEETEQGAYTLDMVYGYGGERG